MCKSFGPEEDRVLGVWCEYVDYITLLPIDWN